MIRRTTLDNIAKLRRTLEDVQCFSRLIPMMENGGFPLKAMEYKARKMAAIHQMAELTSKVIVGLSELAPEQENRITEMKLRGWAIQDRVNDFAYPEKPYYPLDTVFKRERHPILGLFLKREKHSAGEEILMHGEVLIRLTSELFVDLDNAGKFTH